MCLMGLFFFCLAGVFTVTTGLQNRCAFFFDKRFPFYGNLPVGVSKDDNKYAFYHRFPKKLIEADVIVLLFFFL